MENKEIDENGWNEFKLSKIILNQLINMRMRIPTNVQKSCIGKIMEGKSGIIISRTGTGKTACYVIPMLNELSKDIYGIFGVVLAPTR